MENADDCNVTIVKTPIGADFDQNIIMGEKADLITLIHQIEDVESTKKTITEQIVQTKDKIVVGAAETKDKIVETKDRLVEGAIETKDKLVAGATETTAKIVETKDRLVEGAIETKDKLVEGATIVRDESKRVYDEARLATERAALEAKVATECIANEAAHVNLEAKIGKDRMKERLVDVFAFKEDKKDLNLQQTQALNLQGGIQQTQALNLQGGIQANSSNIEEALQQAGINLEGQQTKAVQIEVTKITIQNPK